MGLQLLIVDDSPEDRTLYRRLLAANGSSAYAIDERETGEQGLARLAAGDVDCVLLDYQLPDLDGLEFLEALPASGIEDPPAVVLLTGQGSERVAVEAMKRGAQDYLLKGAINGDVLARAVRHAVDKVELERRVRHRSGELQRSNEELSHEIRERQRAEAELQRTHQALEELVRERTRELEVANQELRREVEERRRAEAERADLLVREREARREAEEANRLKDEFLATVSHELRTPLNAALGWVAVLRSGRVDAATLERGLEVIERNAWAQAQLISDLLDVSGIITGKMRLERQVVDLAEIVAAVEEGARPTAEAKKVRLVTDLAEDLPRLHADPARLQQVVWNLVANALKFVGPGGEVRVSAGADEDEVEIAVADDGAGIPEDFLPHVFERFRQRDSSTTRAHGGLGLGLAIVRHLVELHGGTVTASSDGEGLGSRFSVRLPRPSDQAVEPAAAERAPVPPEGDLSGLRILLVEDEPDTREVCRLVLGERGAEVELAASAAEAWDCFRRLPPDVLIADIGLPGEDGYTLLRRVRAMPCDAGGRVPAAAVTAYADASHAERARQAGFDLHLSKPVLPADLAAAVRRLAGR